MWILIINGKDIGILFDRKHHKALCLWKVSPATIWKIDGRRGACEEGMPVRSLLVKQSQGFQMLEQRCWQWHWELKTAQGFRRHLDITQPPLLSLLQYKWFRIQSRDLSQAWEIKIEHPFSAYYSYIDRYSHILYLAQPLHNILCYYPTFLLHVSDFLG